MIVQPHLTVRGVLAQFVLAPVRRPGIIPTLLPIIIGVLVIELYFGRYEREDLGWNSSVANAVIWIATGLNLILSGEITGSLEKYAAYFLVAAGGFVGYMDFYHRWEPGTAFRVSSPGVIYPLAYVTVVMVKTGIPVTRVSLQASAIFLAATLIGFQLLKGLETPRMSGAYQISR